MNSHESFMRRCFDLARLGAGQVAPNPMVGAVLVHENKVIGEGWHKKYGGTHAEVNALNSVRKEDRHLIKKSRLYVSLEPCCFFGKTPPCTNLIIENQIPKIVISCLDPTPEVAGKGVEILKKAGLKVTTGILKEEGLALNEIHHTFITKKRPFIILKYARSKDGFIGKPGEQIWITNSYSKRLVHKWRSESDAILVGTKTAEIDNPELTNRLYFGQSPLRIVLDKNLTLPRNLNLFDGTHPTWIVNEKKSTGPGGEKRKNPNLGFLKIPFDENLLPTLMTKLFEAKKSTLLVEGGAFTLRQFIEQNLWDEARILTGNIYLGSGIPAPDISGFNADEHKKGADELTFLRNSQA